MSFVKSLPLLESLTLWGNEVIEDLSGLRGKSLRKLNVIYSYFSDFGLLREMSRRNLMK